MKYLNNPEESEVVGLVGKGEFMIQVVTQLNLQLIVWT